MRFILNISFLDCQHRRNVVQSDADPKRELELARLVIPGISAFPQRALGPFEITRTEVHELSGINEVLLLNPALESLNDYRLISPTLSRTRYKLRSDILSSNPINFRSSSGVKSSNLLIDTD